MDETPRPAIQGDSAPPELTVFVSYSRDDLDFVSRLHGELEERGVGVHLDREDIEKGEDWWERLQQLIAESDTVVFVLSPASVDSDVCQREVTFAASMNKRLIPLVADVLGELRPPGALERLNYVFFVPNPRAGATGDFSTAIDELLVALRSDISWIREHTRLGAIARRWASQDHPRDLMIRGAELAAAESWLASRPQDAPAPSDAVRRLITDSRRAATRRQRQWITGSLGVAAGAVSLAAFALIQWNLAEVRLRTSTAQRLAVESQAALFEALEPGGMVRPDVDRSTLLALESLRTERTLEADRALRSSLVNLPGPSREIRIPRDQELLALGPGAGWIAVGGFDQVAVITDGAEDPRPPSPEERIWIESETARFSTLFGAGDEDFGTHPAYAVRHILEPGEGHNGRELELIDRTNGERLAIVPQEWSTARSLFRVDGAFLMTVTGWVSADPEDPSATRLFGSTFYVWDVPGARLRSEMSFAGRGGVQTAAIDPEGAWIALQTDYDAAGSTIVVMPIWPDAVESEACRRLRRNLSQTEVDRYLASSSYEGTCPGLPQLSS